MGIDDSVNYANMLAAMAAAGRRDQVGTGIVDGADLTSEALSTIAASTAMSGTYAPITGSTSYVAKSVTGKQSFDTLDARALRYFRVALANRSSAPVDILNLGDSITWGLKTGSHAANWPAVLRDTLRSRFPCSPTIAGGYGFMSVLENFGSDTFTDLYSVRTGGASGSAGFGLDQLAITWTGAGQKIVYTFTGTGFDLFYAQYSGGGTFYYKIDGGSATNIVTNGSLAYGSRNQAIRSLSVGSHTVEVGWVSGTVFYHGGMSYNGDEAAGIRSWVASYPGTDSFYWADPAHPNWLPMISNVQPALVTIELFPNDWAVSHTPVATSTSQMQSLIANIKAKCTNIPSFVLLPTWPINAAGGTIAAWQSYVDAMYAVALADPDGSVCVCDWQARTSATQGTTIGGILNADFGHPSATGGRYLGEQLADFVRPR